MTVEPEKHPPDIDIAETLVKLAEKRRLYIDCREDGSYEVASKACTVWPEDWPGVLSGSGAEPVQLIAGRLVTAECPKCGSTLLVKDKGAESSNRNTAKP